MQDNKKDKLSNNLPFSEYRNSNNKSSSSEDSENFKDADEEPASDAMSGKSGDEKNRLWGRSDHQEWLQW